MVHKKPKPPTLMQRTKASVVKNASKTIPGGWMFILSLLSTGGYAAIQYLFSRHGIVLWVKEGPQTMEDGTVQIVAAHLGPDGWGMLQAFFGPLLLWLKGYLPQAFEIVVQLLPKLLRGGK